MVRFDAARAPLHAIIACFAVALAASPGGANTSDPDPAALERLATTWTGERAEARGAAFQRLLRSRAPLAMRLHADDAISLQWIDGRGLPRYYTLDNRDAARTIAADAVHPGGSAGLALDGAATPAGRLGLWDGGAVRATHVEFGGRAIQRDSGTLSSHATHVAGTMIAAGVDAGALGMSPAAPLDCWEWTFDAAEMAAAAAAGMRVSNHSYSPAAGWRSSLGQWYWHGDVLVSASEDYGFGFYGPEARVWDQIAFDAPGYLIVASAGNNRSESGPGPGGDHAFWDGTTWVPSTATRDPDGGPTGYDTIPWTKTAKNILVVGAVGDLVSGYNGPALVAMTSYSGWGPTDDGRLKPDLVANGASLWSSTGGSDTAHGSSSGTSMASPSVAGAMNLLVDHWVATHGVGDPRAATLKALAVHTADECGAAEGPDYRFGWGLLNIANAAALIAEDAASGAQVYEKELVDGAVDVYELSLATETPVRFTLAWTDPAATPVAPALDPTDAMLVNDLDLRLADGVATWMPWVLDPSNPVSAAAPGDNVRDNTEQIFVASLPAGSYTIAVTHKGALAGGGQAYSLVASHPIARAPDTVAAPAPEAASVEWLQAAPNPFRSGTSITLRVAETVAVDATIFDVAGRLVSRIASGERSPGLYRIAWDGHRSDGAPAPSGVYFARVRAGAAVRVEKLVLVRPR